MTTEYPHKGLVLAADGNQTRTTHGHPEQQGPSPVTRPTARGGGCGLMPTQEDTFFYSCFISNKKGGSSFLN